MSGYADKKDGSFLNRSSSPRLVARSRERGYTAGENERYCASRGTASSGGPRAGIFRWIIRIRHAHEMSGRTEVRHVAKPWGHETIWAATQQYVGKILHINAREGTSAP